jgi:vacuolar-type H+-ATPase subunit E/Vma4
MEEQAQKQEEIQLSDEEKRTVLEYQRAIDNAKISLTNLRRQYLSSENKILGAITKAEGEYLDHIKKVAAGHGIQEDDAASWVFDPNTFSFSKK